MASIAGEASGAGGVASDSADATSGARGVSIAYAGGGRQPALANVTNLFHSAILSVGAFFDNLFGAGQSSEDGNDDDDDNANGKDRTVPCYCLPCLHCGRGDRGRSNVRAAAALFFPLFLLSFFLLDDLGHAMMRNIKLRNGSRGEKFAPKVKVTHPILRRKSLNEFPGVKRELLWVPLDHMLDVDGHASVRATMRCPRAILFLFHGCGRYAASFFYSPQGRRMVSQAYKRGVAIVAFEKTEELGCWDWADDGEAVLKIGKKFLLSRLLGACGVDGNGDEIVPPIWAFGASSGGSFLAMLAAEMEAEREKHAPFLFSAMNVQIMSPPKKLDWNIPTVFTVMDGDVRTREHVRERVETKFQGGPFKMITTSGQKAIHADHFARAYPDDKQMTSAVSSEIYHDLVNAQVIDPSLGDRLTGDPRQVPDAVTSIWEKYDLTVRTASADAKSKENVLPFGVSHQLLRPLRAEELQDANSIWLIEELNVAWDAHEITAEGFEDVLAFFFEHGVPLK